MVSLCASYWFGNGHKTQVWLMRFKGISSETELQETLPVLKKRLMVKNSRHILLDAAQSLWVA